MKKILSIAMILLCSFTIYAQKDVTKFLGIPVDGSKSQMITKLKAKGFRYNIKEGFLTGEFNGSKVNIYVVTNNNKVYRIMVADATPVSETEIKIRFNKLCEQFSENQRYITPDDYTIPENEDISYQMLVNNKRYQAISYQLQTDKTALQEKAHKLVSAKYTEEQLANATPEIKEDVKNMIANYIIDHYSKKPVWFMINQLLGQYSISIYYDNEYNHANGEDL